MGSRKEHHFYHPFSSTSFGVLLPEASRLENHSGFAIDDMDLYYQPVQNPTVALVFFFIRVPLVILGEFVYVKQLALIKKETGLVNDVSKLIAYVQMIFWPAWLLFTTTTDVLHPLDELAGRWFCDAGWFLSISDGISLPFTPSLLPSCDIVSSSTPKNSPREIEKRKLNGSS